MSIQVFMLSESPSESNMRVYFFFYFTLYLVRELSAPVRVLTSSNVT
jgi:hypothetical protein